MNLLAIEQNNVKICELVVEIRYVISKSNNYYMSMYKAVVRTVMIFVSVMLKLTLRKYLNLL